MPGMIRSGEGQSQVDHDPLAAAAVEIDVHADLARAAERDEQQFFTGDHFEAADCHAVQQTQPLDRQIGLDRVERVGVLVEQGREAARGDDLARAADLALHARGQPLDHRDIAPVDADQHLALGRAADHASVSAGASIAMRGSLAAALTSASSDRLIPGAMIPPL